ncbi:hypothetical protein ACOSQ3_022975 [Xanthoceras sorbifolium]
MRSLPSDQLREPLEGDNSLTVHGGITKTKRRIISIWTIFTKFGDCTRYLVAVGFDKELCREALETEIGINNLSPDMVVD